MRSAIAELINIRESKLLEAKNIEKKKNELEQKMNGAIELYKQNSDERYKQAYLQMSEKMEAGQARLQELENEINEQEKNITHFKSRLIELQKQIDALNKEEADKKVSSQYLFEITRNKTIDGPPRWNTARYANHSCTPNAESDVKKGRVFVIAIKNIKNGEEIVYDYGEEFVKEHIGPHGCRCVAKRHLYGMKGVGETTDNS